VNPFARSTTFRSGNGDQAIVGEVRGRSVDIIRPIDVRPRVGLEAPNNCSSQVGPATTVTDFKEHPEVGDRLRPVGTANSIDDASTKA
jgi:hypothetical protein